MNAVKRSPRAGEKFMLWGKDELQRIADRAARVEQTTLCAFCGARHVGTETSGRLWGAAHRLERHPGAKDRGQHVRRTAAKAGAAPW